jgi:hypothetical protein
VGAWFQRLNIQTLNDCSCEELESIPHILKDCVLREHIHDILRKVSAEGLKAMAEFVASDSTRRLGDHAGASDPHSGQPGGGLSTGASVLRSVL